MNNMTQFMTICALVAVLYQVTSAAPLTNPQANPNKESRKPANHRREEKRTVTVQINAAEDASLERIEEMEREVTKLSRSRRSAAIFLQAALHYCRRMPHLCTSVSATSSDAASVVVMLKDR